MRLSGEEKHQEFVFLHRQRNSLVHLAKMDGPELRSSTMTLKPTLLVFHSGCFPSSGACLV